MINFDLEEIQQLAANAQDPLKQVARKGLEVACGVAGWRRENLAAIGPFGVADPVGSYLYDRVCRPLNPTQPAEQAPAIPFPGGQCPNQYLVSWQVRNVTIGGQPEWFNSQNVIRGPLRFRSRLVLSGTQTQQYIEGRNADGTIAELFLTNLFNNPGPGQQPAIYRNLTLVRTDGQPDNCGSTDPQLKLARPSEPTKYPPPTVTLPPTYPGGPPVNLPWRLPEIKLPIPFTEPLIKVEVGGIGIQIGPRQISLVFSPTINFPINLPGANPTNPELPPGIPEEFREDLSEIKKLLEEVKECACLGDGGPPITIATAVNSGTWNLEVGKSASVSLTMTTQPTNKRDQNGGNAPDVIYAGWFWFRMGSGYMERHPIDAASKAYAVPRKATGFGLTLYNGFLCSVFRSDII